MIFEGIWQALLHVSVGLLALYLGSELLIYGASRLASRLGISHLIIGITIVAMGTSLPEFFVSLISSLRQEQDIIIGNLLSSNMFNMAVILPVFILLEQKRRLRFLDNRFIRFDLPYMTLAGWILFPVFYIGKKGYISRIDGLLLLFCFILYCRMRLLPAIGSYKISIVDKDGKKTPLPICLAAVCGGVILLGGGGDRTLDGAIWLAENTFHVSRYIIGSTLIAFGTSLPELFTAIVALIRKKTDISLGNLIGSSIFNIFFILGIINIISPQRTATALFMSALIISITASIIWIVIRLRRCVPQSLAVLLLGLFSVYIYYLLN